MARCKYQSTALSYCLINGRYVFTAVETNALYFPVSPCRWLKQLCVVVFILFLLQEIDGKALLLLRSEMIMKYMGLKLGPALKLCYHIERLKQGKY